MNYNLKCAVSNLPITNGDRVYLIPISPNSFSFGFKISQRVSAIPIKNISYFLENSDVFNMLNSYFDCKYFDDGSVETVNLSLSNNLFSDRYKIEVDKLFNSLSENPLNISSPLLNIFLDENISFNGELNLDVFINYLTIFGFHNISDFVYITEHNKYTYLVELTDIDTKTNTFKVHIYTLCDAYFNYDKDINPYELTEYKEIVYNGETLVFDKLTTIRNRLINQKLNNHIGFIDAFSKATNIILGFKKQFQHIILELMSMNFMVVRKDILDIAFDTELVYSKKEDIESAILNFKEYKKAFKDDGEDVLNYTSFMLLSTLLKDYMNSGEEILRYINNSDKDLNILSEEINDMVKRDSLVKQFLYTSGTTYMPNNSVSMYEHPELCAKILKKSNQILGEILNENG